MPDAAKPPRPPARRLLRLDDGAAIEYTVQRSRRRKKTVQISVANGAVVVSAPWRAANREIEEVVRGKGGWILERLRAAAQEPPPLGLVTGESLPYLGRELPLVVQEGKVRKASAVLDGGRLLVTLPAGLDAAARREAARAALVAWYRAQAAQVLADSVARWLPALGRREMPRILVREQRTRWGSCSADGTLRFSWRLAMMDPELIDSVAVHELAHLDVMNHSPDFWAVVQRAMPDALLRRQRLNEAGRRLPL